MDMFPRFKGGRWGPLRPDALNRMMSSIERASNPMSRRMVQAWGRQIIHPSGGGDLYVGIVGRLFDLDQVSLSIPNAIYPYMFAEAELGTQKGDPSAWAWQIKTDGLSTINGDGVVFSHDPYLPSGNAFADPMGTVSETLGDICIASEMPVSTSGTPIMTGNGDVVSRAYYGWSIVAPDPAGGIHGRYTTVELMQVVNGADGSDGILIFHCDFSPPMPTGGGTGVITNEGHLIVQNLWKPMDRACFGNGVLAPTVRVRPIWDADPGGTHIIPVFRHGYTAYTYIACGTETLCGGNTENCVP